MLEYLLNSPWQLGEKVHVTNQKTNPMAACQYRLYRKCEFVHAKSILEGNKF